MTKLSDNQLNDIRNNIERLLLKMRKSIEECEGENLLSCCPVFVSEVLFDASQNLPLKMADETGVVTQIDTIDKLFDLFCNQVDRNLCEMLNHNNLLSDKKSIH